MKILSGDYLPAYTSEVGSLVRASALITASDKTPESTTWPAHGHSPSIWYQAPGPLAEPRNKMWRMVENIRTASGRRVERQYFSDYIARNVHSAAHFRAKLESIQHILTPPATFKFPDVPTVVRILRAIGLGRTRYSEVGYGAILPANGQASIGITHQLYRNRFVLGAKDDYWPVIQQGAMRLRRDIVPDLKLRWSDPAAKWQRLMHEHLRVFIAYVRNDGGKGFLSPRVIWGGDGEMYCLEQELFRCVREDLRNHWVVPFNVDLIEQRFQHVTEEPGHFLSLDYSRWDLTQTAKAMRTVWQALTQVYKLPPDVAKYCAAYNITAPLLQTDNNRQIYLSRRYGNIPSGSGSFVWINHILHIVYMVDSIMTLESLSLEDALARVGQVYGDDGWLKTRVSAIQWSNHCSKRYGLVMKPKQTLESDDTIVFLRKLFSQTTSGFEPVVMSRWRNALCPRLTDPGRAPPALKAVIARSQYMDLLYNLFIRGTSGKYSQINKYWTSVVRAETFMYPMSDAELGKLLPRWAKKHMRQLNRAKSWLNVVDSLALYDKSDIAD